MKSVINFLVLFFTLANARMTLADSAKFEVLDVRTPVEYTENHLKESSNIDFLKSDFKEQILKLDKTKSYKIYCRSGNRSSKAMELMKSLGFKNVENLGSLQQAAKVLNRNCESPAGC